MQNFSDAQRMFDPAEAERLKREGMERAAEKRAWALRMARHWAHFAATLRVRVTADDVFSYLPPEPASILGPAAGSIFKERKNGQAVWKFTGNWVKSERTSNHGRCIRVWELR